MLNKTCLWAISFLFLSTSAYPAITNRELCKWIIGAPIVAAVTGFGIGKALTNVYPPAHLAPSETQERTFRAPWIDRKLKLENAFHAHFRNVQYGDWLTRTDSYMDISLGEDHTIRTLDYSGLTDVSCHRFVVVQNYFNPRTQTLGAFVVIATESDIGHFDFFEISHLKLKDRTLVSLPKDGRLNEENAKLAFRNHVGLEGPQNYHRVEKAKHFLNFDDLGEGWLVGFYYYKPHFELITDAMTPIKTRTAFLRKNHGYIEIISVK